MLGWNALENATSASECYQIKTYLITPLGCNRCLSPAAESESERERERGGERERDGERKRERERERCRERGFPMSTTNEKLYNCIIMECQPVRWPQEDHRQRLFTLGICTRSEECSLHTLLGTLAVQQLV